MWPERGGQLENKRNIKKHLNMFKKSRGTHLLPQFCTKHRAVIASQREKLRDFDFPPSTYLSSAISLTPNFNSTRLGNSTHKVSWARTRQFTLNQSSHFNLSSQFSFLLVIFLLPLHLFFFSFTKFSACSSSSEPWPRLTVSPLFMFC